jgi:WD40 repeat protein
MARPRVSSQSWSLLSFRAIRANASKVSVIAALSLASAAFAWRLILARRSSGRTAKELSIDNVEGEPTRAAPCHLVPSGEEVAYALVDVSVNAAERQATRPVAEVVRPARQSPSRATPARSGARCSRPKAGRILTASEDKTARLWDGDGKPLAILSGHTDRVTSAVFSRDGGRILTASADNTARLWDGDGKPLVTLHHADEVTSAVFSPDGDHIMTASRGTARLWDHDGKPLVTLQGHTGAIRGAVFAPEGGRILTASEDKTARLWDGDGKPLAILSGHTDRVTSAVFSPNGGRIVTLFNDGIARIWEAFPDPQDLVDHVKAQVPRCLTPEQRERLFLAPEPPRWCIDMHKWPYDGTTPAK